MPLLLNQLPRLFFLVVAVMLANIAHAQVCAAPGKDAPGTISGILNTYYQGTNNLLVNATSLTLGAVSGAAGTVTIGDKLLIIQMQGADINAEDNERYGNGVGAVAFPDTSASQANGYTALNLAGGYTYVQVITAAGNAVTFTPALTNAYAQDVANQPRRTYQVIRVPQLPSATIASGAPVTPLAWTGLVGGIVAIDVTGRLTFTGAGPHIEASNRGFRGGDQGVNDSSFPNAGRQYRSLLTADGGSKGEGIAGTPRYVQTSTAGTFNNGTRFSDGAPTRADNGAAMGYNLGNYRRGAPANAGGGGNSHNAAGGGGGNGGEGGGGGQTYNGDGLLDTGGYGGSRTPQDGVLLATRIFMGGGGGSGSLNNGTSPRGSGGNGGGIIILRTGSVSGAGVLRTDGQRAWDSDASNDAGGGGGAGGSVLLIAGSGHSSITVQARGGDGADSNIRTGNEGFAPPSNGISPLTQGACCGGELEGPGGGGGGGALYANATVGSLALGGGINGLSREDKAGGNSGNMRAAPGGPGASLQTIAAASIPGAREGYACIPALTVTKRTNTPALSVPPNTSGTYIINVSNAAGLSGVAYGVAITDVLSSPFQLTGTTATITYSVGASGPASPMVISGAGTVAIGTPGSPSNAFTLAPGSNVTATFKIGLNGATAGTYQNPAIVTYSDPTRTAGGNNTAVNPAVSPGGTNAAGGTVPGSNYASGSSTQEDIVITGAAGTSADLGLVKTGPSTVEIGQPVQYTVIVTNSGPSNIPGSITIADTVPANIGTVTWVCTLTAGVGDCDTTAAGPGAAGSGSVITLNKVGLNSGGQLTVIISGTAFSNGDITNTATVSLPTGFTDPTPSNNTGTATTSITIPAADLSVTKTNGVSSVFTNGATAYTIVVANAGPSAANNAVVADPPSPGLQLQTVSCSGAGGAVCPGGLTTSTFQAGATLATFPSGGALTFIANYAVTAASGTTVTNTVTVTGPPGLTEINTGNNTASDADAVAAAVSRVVSAAQICQAGSTEQLTNLLANSDYANTSSSVGSFVPQGAANSQATDTSVAVQVGPKNYGPDVVVQSSFPGDSSRSVASANNWLYNNGNNTGGVYRFWSQTVTGLVPGRTYEWMYYGSNALNRGSAAAALPTIQMRVLTTTTFTLLTSSFPNEGAGTSDTWTLQQSIFPATATSVILQLWDAAPAGFGDDFASTQVLLRECKPNTDPFVTKTNGTNTLGTLTTTTYVVTVGNNGPGPADGIIVRDALITGLNKTGITCAAFGSGATCPPSSTVSGIEGAGLTIPSLPINTTVIFTITASVTALNGTVTNTVNLQLPPGMADDNPGNNAAADVDAIRGAANLSVTKANGTNTVLAGGTTAYTITVANAGPSNASGAVVSDPITPGLSCVTAVTCTASGGASCAASIPIGTLQSGYTIPALPAGGQINIVLTCGVTATGQ